MKTDKAEHILNSIRRRDRKGLKRWSKLQANPQVRERILDQFNQSTLDGAAPVGGGGEKQSKFLKEMNEFEQDHDQFIESLRDSRLGSQE
jgi:hypothetical protein